MFSLRPSSMLGILCFLFTALNDSIILWYAIKPLPYFVLMVSILDRANLHETNFDRILSPDHLQRFQIF